MEDHADTCDLITSLLPDCGVIAARTKAEALHRRAYEAFELYLLNFHLPDGTGKEIARFIRTLDPKTLILFATAFDGIGEAVLAEFGTQGLIKRYSSS
mgnify:CR=1 FL=1